MASPPLRAAIYTRVSTEHQANERNVSLADQLARCTAFCETSRHRIVAHYQDIASGRRSDRIAYRRMLDACRGGEIDLIVVMFLDRFGRNVREAMERIWELEDLKVYWWSTEERTGNQPTDDADDGLLRHFAPWMAERDSKRISARTRSAIATKLRTSSTWFLPRVPYGWRKDAAGVVVIDDAEAAVVRRMARDYLDGHSLRSIATRLADEGLRNRVGTNWRHHTIRWLLTRPQNRGTVIWGREHNPDGKREIVTLPDRLPPLLDETTLTALAERFSRCRTLGRAVSSPHLLSGLLRCGVCGQALCVQWGGRKANRTRGFLCESGRSGRACTRPGMNYHHAGKLEAAVLAEVRAFASTDAIAAATPAPSRTDQAAQLRALRADLATIEQAFAKTLDLYLRGVIADEAQFGAGNQRLSERRQAVEQQIAAVEQSARRERERTQRAADVRRRADELLGNSDAPIATRKALLAELVERIIVYPDKPFDVVWGI